LVGIGRRLAPPAAHRFPPSHCHPPAHLCLVHLRTRSGKHDRAAVHDGEVVADVARPLEIVGYSRMTGEDEDEAGTAKAVREHREAAHPITLNANYGFPPTATSTITIGSDRFTSTPVFGCADTVANRSNRRERTFAKALRARIKHRVALKRRAPHALPWRGSARPRAPRAARTRTSRPSAH